MENRFSARQLGIGLAAITAVVSGFAVFINGYGVRAWREAGASATTYTTMKNLIAAMVLLALAAVALRGRSFRIASVDRPTRLRLVAIGIVGGAIPFVLFFEGLARASSGQAAFIHKTLVVWVALLAVPLLGERITGLHLGAIGLLVGGQAVIHGVGDIGAGSGEIMILAATLLWAVEVIVAKRVLTEVPAAVGAAARMGIGAIALIGWSIVTGGLSSLSAMGASEWGWVALTGSVLTAYVASWYFALSKAPAVDVTAVLVLGAVITAGLRNGIQDVPLPSTAGLGLVAVGALLAVGAGLRARSTAE